MSVVQKQIFVLSYSSESRQKYVRVVQNHISHYFAPDPADPPETVSATAGPNLLCMPEVGFPWNQLVFRGLNGFPKRGKRPESKMQ